MNQYPMNDLRNPLGKAFYDLTQQVEALGGSPELTDVVVAIGALRDQVGAALATKPPAGEQKPVARVAQHDATVRLEWASVEAAHNAKPGPLYTAPVQPEQVAQDSARIDWLEKVGTVRIQRMRRMDPKAPKYWDVEYGIDETLSRAASLREAIDAARARGEGKP